MGQWMSSRQFSLCHKIFMFVVHQEDTETRVITLWICTVALTTEENILPKELFFTLASFHCRLFKYGSFSSSTGHVYTLNKCRGGMVVLMCIEVTRVSDWGQKVREGERGNESVHQMPLKSQHWAVSLSLPVQSLHISFTYHKKTYSCPHVSSAPLPHVVSCFVSSLEA